MTYDEILATPGTSLILFYGAACAPCAALKPELRAHCQVRQLTLHELNTAGELEAARTLRLRSVPSVVLVRDGKPQVIATGRFSHAELFERMQGLRG